MNGFRFEGDVGRELNELARHNMIVKLLADIKIDMTICDIEGWDKMEYLRQLKNEIDHFMREE